MQRPLTETMSADANWLLTLLKLPQISRDCKGILDHDSIAPFFDGMHGSITVLEGGIACGKTTAGKSLIFQRAARQGGLHVFFEEPLDTVSLGEYIKDPKSNAFGFQLHMLRVRIFLWKWAIALAKLGIHVILDRSLYGDWAFAYVNFLNGNISGKEFAEYMEEFRKVSTNLLEHSGILDISVVYIRQTIRECLDRIAIRGRSCESGYSESYLELLILVYDALFGDCKEDHCVPEEPKLLPEGATLSEIIKKISEMKSVSAAAAVDAFWKNRRIVKNPLVEIQDFTLLSLAGNNENADYDCDKSVDDASNNLKAANKGDLFSALVFQNMMKEFQVNQETVGLKHFGADVTVRFMYHCSYPTVQRKIPDFANLRSVCGDAVIDDALGIVNHLAALAGDSQLQSEFSF